MASKLLGPVRGTTQAESCFPHSRLCQQQFTEWQLSCRKPKQPWILRRRHGVLLGARPQVLSGKEVLKQLQKFQIKDQEFRGSVLIQCSYEWGQALQKSTSKLLKECFIMFWRFYFLNYTKSWRNIGRKAAQVKLVTFRWGGKLVASIGVMSEWMPKVVCVLAELLRVYRTPGEG